MALRYSLSCRTRPSPSPSPNPSPSPSPNPNPNPDPNPNPNPNQDPARAFNLVQQEARNTVTRTPEGLETPSYRVSRQGEGYEVREYEAFDEASTALAEGESDLVSGGQGFNPSPNPRPSSSP